MIDARIFRAYDIRGVAFTQLTEDACLQIGNAFGKVLVERYGKEHPHPSVVVGRDARTHSAAFQAAVMQGLIAAGCEALDIGQTPSPVNYFTICHRKLDGGIHVTASHNPKEDNGLKLQTRDADAFSGESLQELREQIEKKDFLPPKGAPSGPGKGTQETIDAIGPYVDHLVKLFPNAAKGLTVAVDGGNGVAGPVTCDVLRKAGAEVIELYTEPDGNFPNHPADPSKHSTLRELQKTVKETSADIGFALDGDGDRLGVIDERGQIVTADQTLLLLAQDHLRRHPGKPVVFTVSNSEMLNTEIEKWGGQAWMTKVGHSYVEHAMREQHALLGGEQSGHFFCGEDFYGFDDALVAALRILSIVNAKSSTTVSTLISAFPTVYQSPELRPFCPDDAKGKIIAAITAHFSRTHPVITLDGVRIDFGDGAWAGIRQSNTSPCISVCMEARSTGKLTEIRTIVLEHLKNYPEIVLE